MDLATPVGYLAAGLVLATFGMRDMVALRATAIASNVAFLAYGLLARIDPVLLLHVLLIPMNAARLAEALRVRHAAAATPDTGLSPSAGEPT